MIGDAMGVRGWDVQDIMTGKSAKPHTLTDFTKVDGTGITYPPDPDKPDAKTVV